MARFAADLAGLARPHRTGLAAFLAWSRFVSSYLSDLASLARITQPRLAALLAWPRLFASHKDRFTARLVASLRL